MVWAAKRDRKDVKHVGELTLYGLINIIIAYSKMHRINRFDKTEYMCSDKLGEIVREAY